MKKVYLMPERMIDRYILHDYIQEIFEIEDYFGSNLDAVSDVLSEVEEDITLVLTKETTMQICDHAYAYRALIVLGGAANENPHIKIVFRP